MDITSCIVYEDDMILVCHKPAGMAVQNAKVGTMDLESALKNYLAEQTKEEPYLGVIHRLDLPVEGLLVFAKTKRSARILNEFLQAGAFEKHYLAIVNTEPQEDDVTLVNWLLKDEKQNLSRVVPSLTEGAKPAKLKYSIIADNKGFYFLDIELLTGRHHQIRVQMANAGLPLLGDRKYGKENGYHGSLCLCAYSLGFPHPMTNQMMHFEIKPPAAWFTEEE